MKAGTPRLMVAIAVATGVVVAVVAALALKSWLVLGLALAVHAVGTTLVVGYAMKLAGEDSDKPDPVTEARRD
jgi:hypothetical protein